LSRLVTSEGVKTISERIYERIFSFLMHQGVARRGCNR
jgi:hypothetical protein